MKSEQDTGARELLMKMMEVFILKFKAIALYQIPELFKHCQPSPPSDPGVSPSHETAVTSSTSNGDVKKSGSPTPSSSGTLGEGGREAW